LPVAGLIMRGGGFGILGNIAVGILGALIGSLLFNAFNVSVGGDFWGPLLMALVGSLILLFLVGIVRRSTV